jgi:polyisoprenyl-teichoic acid--peptidoglycan teichoic acid transferase
MIGPMVRWIFGGAALSLAGILAGLLLHFLVSHGAMIVGWPSGERINVLIMGLDRTVSDENPSILLPISRTDVLIAASFDPVSHRLYLLSIPRDTQAPIPGRGTQKINAAHAYGGAPLTLETVENFLGVPFPYYLEITERGLVHLIDAVGGVNVYVDKDMDYDDNWDGLHIHLKKGYRRLGGKAATDYTRFRRDQFGDITRIGRGQLLISALIDELRRPRVIFRVGRILRVFREDIMTNLPLDQLLMLGWFTVRLPGNSLLRATLPGELGAVDWFPDRVKDRLLALSMFYDVDRDTLAKTTVDVVNATGTPDALADPLARLAALGVRVVRVSEDSDGAETVLIVHRGDTRVGKIVATMVGARLIVANWRGSAANLTLVLGRSIPRSFARPVGY